jgi:hypothetical protein
LYGYLAVYLDIVKDGKIDVRDVALVSKYWGRAAGDGKIPLWETFEMCDIDGNLKINIIDVSSVARSFGERLIPEFP